MLYACVVWSPLCVRSWICFPFCLASNAVCTSKLVFQNGLLSRRFLLVFLWPLPQPLGWPSLADWIGACFFRCESLVIACLRPRQFVLVLPGRRKTLATYHVVKQMQLQHATDLRTELVWPTLTKAVCPHTVVLAHLFSGLPTRRFFLETCSAAGSFARP